MKTNKSKNLFTEELKRIKKVGILMGIFAVLFIFLIFILSHLTYSRSAEKYFAKQAVETLTNISEQMSEKISAHINSWYVELKYVGKAVSQTDLDEDIYDVIKKINAVRYSEFDDIGVMTKDGRIYFDKDKVVDISSEPYIKECIESGNEYAGCPEVRAFENSLVFSIPYTSGGDKIINGERIIGSVGLIDKERVSAWLDTKVFGEKGTYIVITDKDGKIIANNDKTKEVGLNILDTLNSYVYDEESFEALKTGLESGSSGDLYMDDQSVKFITYYAPLNYTLSDDDETDFSIEEWRILVMTREAVITKNISELFDESRIFLYAVLLIFAVVLVLTCLMYSKNKLTECVLKSIDMLTGVYNNKCFEKDANILLSRGNGDYAAIAFNISKFRFINNEIGHEKGDIVLKTVGKTILDNLREDELVTHSFADRFMMLVKLRGRTPEETVDYFRTKLNEAEYPDGIKMKFNAGVYKIKPDEHDISLPMDCARFAQDRIREKNGANNGIMIYSQEMLDKQKSEFEFERRAAEAVEKGYFKVYYQLKRDIQNNRWCGAEALVRWIDPKLGFISPGEFIPLFEKNGFVKTIDKYVFECVCRDIDNLIKSGNKVCPVSVNVSRKHLDNNDFMYEYEKILLSYDIPHELIEFEITETMIAENEELLKKFISWVHGLGCKCSLDDFGCGYSSFNMVKEFDFDTIKLDRKFFYGSNGFDSSSQQIVESLIDLSHKLGKSVISEGIENEEQVAFLKSRRCDAVQGFYFSKPAPLDESIGKLI
ncbi:MAG: GGDEF domain-containing protein [bacterium]|nr:GGDEF domain-containing protein [bacterium]